MYGLIDLFECFFWVASMFMENVERNVWDVVIVTSKMFNAISGIWYTITFSFARKKLQIKIFHISAKDNKSKKKNENKNKMMWIKLTFLF